MPGIADDELALLPRGELDKLSCMIRQQDHRLFEHDVQTACQTGASDLVMSRVPHRHDDAIEIFALDHLLVVGIGPGDVVLRRRLRQHIFPRIRQGHELSFWIGDQGRNVGGRRPPAGTDDGNARSVRHRLLSFHVMKQTALQRLAS